MKPEWKDAPEWAQYLAADLTTEASHPECWVWFEDLPVWSGCGWLCGESHSKWLQTKYQVPLLFDAEHSLEKRP